MQPATATVIPAEAEAVTVPASAAQAVAITGRGLAVQVADLDELGQDAAHRLDRLGHHDRGAQRGHGAGDVDDAPQAELGADVGAVGAHGERSVLGQQGTAEAGLAEAGEEGGQPLGLRPVEDRRSACRWR